MQTDKLAYLLKDVIERLGRLERKNNSVLLARINQLEKRVERLEQQ